MRNAEPVDAFRAYRTRIAADGTLLAAGKAVRQPLLVSQYGATGTPQNAEPGPGGGLYRAVGPPPAAAVPGGPDETGRTDGTLTLSLGLPETIRATRVTLSAPGYSQTVMLSHGAPAVIRVPVSGTRPFTLKIASPPPLGLPGGPPVPT